jgi:hypothetical protein
MSGRQLSPGRAPTLPGDAYPVSLDADRRAEPFARDR